MPLAVAHLGPGDHRRARAGLRLHACCRPCSSAWPFTRITNDSLTGGIQNAGSSANSSAGSARGRPSALGGSRDWVSGSPSSAPASASAGWRPAWLKASRGSRAPRRQISGATNLPLFLLEGVAILAEVFCLLIVLAAGRACHVRRERLLVQPDPASSSGRSSHSWCWSALLAKFAWRPLLEALERREKTIARAIEDAERARAGARARAAGRRRSSSARRGARPRPSCSRSRAAADRLGEELRQKAVGRGRRHHRRRPSARFSSRPRARSSRSAVKPSSCRSPSRRRSCTATSRRKTTGALIERHDQTARDDPVTDGLDGRPLPPGHAADWFYGPPALASSARAPVAAWTACSS